MARPIHVPFLSVEDEHGDFIVGFALGEGAHNSLTLLRTPKFEFLLDDDERGVSVGSGGEASYERELLVSVMWSDRLVEIESTRRRYQLDVTAVDPAEVKEAKAVLRKMNFDRRFRWVNV